MRAALTALSLSRDPLADIARAVPEFDALGVGERQQLHRMTVDQLDLGEIESDHTAILELRANDVQVFRGKSTTDAQHHTTFNREPVDSAGHALVG